MSVRGEAQIGADRGSGFVGVTKETLGLLGLLAMDVAGEGLAGLFFEFGGEVGAAHEELGRHFFGADGLG